MMPTKFHDDLAAETNYMDARVHWLRNLHGLAVRNNQPTDVLEPIHSALESAKDAVLALHRAERACCHAEAGGAT